ncbi:alginate biosynthesis transcriptional regulatory protein AlgB [Desulfosarcina widdelii]|uniref:Alginate biosynthesis transcriptional regulatory protein AlgB n=1 Tax=Desulfosarcina widdelii TaxID=947919 RepID=A0A5K7Z5C6_9BACT|nr:sigma-54 dependent transcriptional regulator [Desulfosarcina widdelii]BBO76208.1 alginate biosynthesis transcriptional regulatory protein AlgB [Desulfosarcina widdelii]
MKRALIIDDDKNILTTLEVYLEDKGFDVITAGSGEAGINHLRGVMPDLVLLDMKLPDRDGLDVLKEIMASGIKTQVLIITAYATIETAVSAVKMGAFDYLPKPFVPDQLDLILEKLKRFHHMEVQIATLKGIFSEGGILTRNHRMRKILQTARQAADSEAIVLVSGESGTGKGLLARLIHDWSPRKGKAFVTVDCAALQENLLESDLFGHIKGAFTGALRDKEGKLKLAEGGTVFLDEVSEIPAAVQGKLLRFIQHREYERLGDPNPHTVDVRIIAATNKDLEEMVRDGRFREDLYFRLNVLELFLPPLRERPEDVTLLADHYLKQSSRINEKTVRRISDDASHHLQCYTWPGNVRELINTIERSVIMTQGTELSADDLPPHIAKFNPVAAGESSLKSLEEIEKDHIQSVISHTPSLDEAAKVLGIDPATLWRKRKKYQLD